MNEPINPYEPPSVLSESRVPPWLGFALVLAGCLLVPVLFWMIFGKIEIRR
jgi:hypothetical protein